MTRRLFFCTCASMLPGGATHLRLEAIAAPEMPRRLLLPAHLIRQGAGVYEVRTYEPPGIAHALLSRAGVNVVQYDGVTWTYVIAFASLAARAVAWDKLNADSVWTSARPRLRHLSLWSPQCYLRI